VFLDIELPGVDETRARAIYDAGFQTREQLESVTVEELLKVPCINPTLARKIIHSLKGIEDEHQDIAYDPEQITPQDLENDKFKFNFDSDPGKLLYIIKKPLVLRMLPVIIALPLGLIMGLSIAFALMISPIISVVCIVGFAVFLIFVFIAFIYYSMQFSMPDHIRFYQNGILVSVRRVGGILGPPKSYFRLWWSNIYWVWRFRYHFIPLHRIIGVYTVQSEYLKWYRYLIVVEPDQSWHAIPIYGPVVDDPSIFDDILEKLRVVFGKTWPDVFQGSF
jgi:hypothetical protein